MIVRIYVVADIWSLTLCEITSGGEAKRDCHEPRIIKDIVQFNTS